MHHLLVIVGVFIALAGIGSIAAGAPSWALGLGLGSSLIQSGAIGIVGGLLLVGIGFVLRALQELSRRVDALSLIDEMSAAHAAPAAPARTPARHEPLPSPAVPGLARREPLPPFAMRDEPEEEPAPVEEEDDRNLLEPEERTPSRSWPPATEPRKAEQPLPAERPLSVERRFERPALGNERPLAEAEHRRERPRFPQERPASPRHYGDRESLARNGGTAASTTVVRSGIISGMAYTLYTDGSIEAELPIGTVRFASIEELQDHVSQTGEDADVNFGGPRAPKIR